VPGGPRFSPQGKCPGCGCTGRDITAEQRRRAAVTLAAAEAEAASRAKSSLLANMSHEVHTPLNGIISLARIARQHVGEQRERLVDYPDLISEGACALYSRLTDVLDHAPGARDGPEGRRAFFRLAQNSLR
jgi:signal transduction histidine kinase